MSKHSCCRISSSAEQHRWVRGYGHGPQVPKFKHIVGSSSCTDYVLPHLGWSHSHTHFHAHSTVITWIAKDRRPSVRPGTLGWGKRTAWHGTHK